MPTRPLSIRYPRRRVLRSTLRALSRLLLALLTKTRITGRDRFPETRPLLIVNNHDAAIEVALLIAYAPWQVELLGADDIPPPFLIQVLG